MAGQVAKFLALSAQEKTLLLRAMIALPLTTAMLRIAGFQRCQSATAHLPATRMLPALPAPKRVAKLVEIASRRGLHRGNCLSQSLVLWSLLCRAGVPGQLRIGARKVGEGLEAHAWVEHEGRPLNDTQDVTERFPPFPTLFTAELPPVA